MQVVGTEPDSLLRVPAKVILVSGGDGTKQEYPPGCPHSTVVQS
jgi:hypothetical protein